MQDEVDLLIFSCTLAQLDNLVQANDILIRASEGLDIQHYYEERGSTLRHARDIKEYIYVNNLSYTSLEYDDPAAEQILYLQKRLNELSPQYKHKQGVTPDKPVAVKAVRDISL